MTRIDEMIKEKCSDGVVYRTLTECFEQFSGLNGVSNKWAENGNCRFIDYMNAYSNLAIDVNKKPYATVKSFKQNTLQKGDILFTSASEVPDECALSSVIEDEIEDGIFLDDHLFGLRTRDEYKNELDVSFLKYVFRSQFFRRQVRKAVRGVTRFYLSKPDFMKTKIPIPPLEVQKEIAGMLNSFTELEAELEAELTKRKQQYVYYRDYLLNKESADLVTIDDLCNVTAGGDVPKESMSKVKSEQYSIPIISNGIGGNALYGYTEHPKITTTSVTVSARGTIGYAEYRDYPYYPIVRLLSLMPKDCERLNTKYLYYCLQGKEYKLPTSGIPQLTAPDLKKVRIPVPTKSIQDNIVRILDKFDTICNNLSDGLPAEIEARHKQYEYYRDKLLTFEEIKR